MSALSALLCGVVGCGPAPTSPVLPGVPNIGALVYSAAEIVHNSAMEWVGPDDRIAFRSWNGQTSYLKLLDLRTGEARILDGPNSSFGGPGSTLFRQTFGTDDGELVYYVTTVGSSNVIRRVAPSGGSPKTLVSNGGYGGIVLAPGESQLAYGGNSLALLDLETMLTAEISGASEPVFYSPDGSELLVYDLELAQLARLQLAFGTKEPLDLGSTEAEAFAARWDPSGISVLGQDHDGLAIWKFPSGTGLASLSSLGSVGVGERISGGALAATGDAFGIWTRTCAGAGPFGGCSLTRFTVYVGTVDEGRATAIGSKDSDEEPALLFSRDGTRLYYALGGVLYVVGAGR